MFFINHSSFQMWLCRVRLSCFILNSSLNYMCSICQHCQRLVLYYPQVFTDMIPLDQVYAVYPHPTKSRVFGILADHSSSGTVHSFCFTANSANTVRLFILGSKGIPNWFMCIRNQILLAGSGERTILKGSCIVETGN